MSNRWFRLAIAVLAIGAATAAAVRLVQHERARARVEESGSAGVRAAEAALAAAAGIQIAQAAYVAPGQGDDFWTARVDELLGRLRTASSDLGHAASSFALTAPSSDRLAAVAAADARIRTHLKAGQSRLAAEVVFTDARDALDAIRAPVALLRDEIAGASAGRQAEIRREQALLALASAVVLALAILVLVPPARAAAEATTVAPVAVVPTAPRAAADEEAAVVFPTAASHKPASGRVPKVRVGSIEPVPVAPPTPAVPLVDAAAVCTDLGRVSQSNEIAALLGRAAAVLSASGVIVWLATENRDELYAAAASGYPERLLSRIGSIRRDAANLTAAAFRDGTARTSPRGPSAAAALAAPLMTPHGPVGIFSAELRDVAEVDPERLAVAVIFAAQLAGLLGTVPLPSQAAPEESEPAEPRRAQNA